MLTESHRKELCDTGPGSGGEARGGEKRRGQGKGGEGRGGEGRGEERRQAPWLVKRECS